MKKRKNQAKDKVMLTNYLKEVRAKDDVENFDPDFKKFGSQQTPPPKKNKEKTQDINEEDRGV